MQCDPVRVSTGAWSLHNGNVEEASWGTKRDQVMFTFCTALYYTLCIDILVFGDNCSIDLVHDFSKSVHPLATTKKINQYVSPTHTHKHTH